MASLPDLAITGSTGGLGGMVAHHLAEAGSAQRLLVRDFGRAPELEGAVPLVFSYADSALAGQALEGAKVLFMVSAAEAEDRLEQSRKRLASTTAEAKQAARAADKAERTAMLAQERVLRLGN